VAHLRYEQRHGLIVVSIRADGRELHGIGIRLWVL